MLLGKIVCFMLRCHLWRRPRKNEPAGFKVCRRCGLATAIKAHKAAA